jgi:hypothetical protein
MSDSASDHKVEDVLSSVRRLVSNELPRNRRPALSDGPGALVLTDAQRVEKVSTARAASKSLEDRIAELEVAVSKRTDEWEPDGSEDQAQHRPDRIVFTRPPSNEEQGEVRRSTLRLSQIALIETGPADDDDDSQIVADQPVTFRHESDDVAKPQEEPHMSEDEAPMAEDVESEPAPMAEVAAFRNPDDVIEGIEARWNRPRERSEPKSVAVAEAESDVADASGETRVETGDAIDDDIAALDAEVAESDEFDGDTDGSSDVSGLPEGDDLPEETGLSDETDTDEDFEAALVAAVGESLPEDIAEDIVADVDMTGSGLAPAAAMPDSEALRPLVAELIREELQGELGERITRNVRKLVRREILRALNAREVE